MCRHGARTPAHESTVGLAIACLEVLLRVARRARRLAEGPRRHTGLSCPAPSMRWRPWARVPRRPQAAIPKNRPDALRQRVTLTTSTPPAPPVTGQLDHPE